MEKLKLDFFYGRQGEQHSYLIVPKVLFTEREFSPLSESAKLLYSILLDRNSLSISKGDTFNDSEGRTYIYFSIAAVMEHLGCAEQKAIKIMSELEKVGLIEKKRLGLGKANRIYVKDIFSLSQFKNHENHNSATLNNNVPVLRKSQCSNTEFSNTEFSKPQSINRAHSELTERKIVPEDVKQEMLDLRGIPYQYARDKQCMVQAIHNITSWDTYYPSGYSDELEQSAYEMMNECLIDMATDTEIRSYCNTRVSYAMVIDKINASLKITQSYIVLDYAFVTEFLSDYLSAITTKEIKSPASYMKSCLWNSFSTYKVQFHSTVERLINGLP